MTRAIQCPSGEAGAPTAPTDENNANARAVPPLGATPPAVDIAFLGAVLWTSPANAAEPLALVEDDDLESPHVASVLAMVRQMHCARKPVEPALVVAELARCGASKPQHDALIAALTCGASGQAVREYAAAVVSASLRRRLESAAAALRETATTGAELELVGLAERIAARARSIARRLARLRGEQT